MGLRTAHVLFWGLVKPDAMGETTVLGSHRTESSFNLAASRPSERVAHGNWRQPDILIEVIEAGVTVVNDQSVDVIDRALEISKRSRKISTRPIIVTKLIAIAGDHNFCVLIERVTVDLLLSHIVLKLLGLLGPQRFLGLSSQIIQSVTGDGV